MMNLCTFLVILLCHTLVANGLLTCASTQEYSEDDDEEEAVYLEEEDEDEDYEEDSPSYDGRIKSSATLSIRAPPSRAVTLNKMHAFLKTKKYIFLNFFCYLCLIVYLLLYFTVCIRSFVLHYVICLIYL